MKRQDYGTERRHSTKIIVVVLVGFLLLGGLCVLYFWEEHLSSTPSQGPVLGSNELEYNGEIYRLKRGVETVLVMGIDKFGEDVTLDSYKNNQQADFLMLLIIDKTEGTCTALHLNRDTMAKVTILGFGGKKAGTVVEQIALAHTYGSGGTDSSLNTVRAVSDLLHGLPIDYYVTLTMDAVEILNDMVGGVTVTVLDDFTGIDDTLKEGETVTLRGEQALLYVRNRYGLDDSTNLSRMERQRQYLSALYEQTMFYIENTEHFISDAASQLTGYMNTDCTVDKLNQIFETVTEYQIEDMQTLQGESVLGEEFMEFIVDQNALKQQVIDLFYEVKKK